MITNDRQYKSAKNQILSFQASLDEISKSSATYEDIHPLIAEASKNAMEAQLKELVAEVEEYEALKEGRIVITDVKNLSELPLVLIKSRIANGFTQSELADALGMKEQQIQRYEAELYNTASLKTLLKIAETLKVTISGDAQIKEIKPVEVPSQFNIANYPFKEMVKRKWFTGFNGTMNEAVQKSSYLLFQLFDRAGFNNLQYNLTRKTVRTGGELNKFALDAWYAHIINEAHKHPLSTRFNRATITDDWLTNLARLSQYEDGPKRAIKYLNDSGICLLVEGQLEGTYLDGAALLLENKQPIIALTLRHDRLDNFWFVLFHEIAHIKLHLGEDIDAIFDDLDIKSDGIEKEADLFALNALIPNDVWKKSLVRFSPSKETIINQALKLEVHPSLVAGRIRRETGKYFQFTELIGQGEVRKHF